MTLPKPTLKLSLTAAAIIFVAGATIIMKLPNSKPQSLDLNAKTSRLTKQASQSSPSIATTSRASTTSVSEPVTATKNTSHSTTPSSTNPTNGSNISSSSPAATPPPTSSAPTPLVTQYCYVADGTTYHIWSFQGAFTNQALYATVAPGDPTYEVKTAAHGVIIYVNGNWWGACPGPMPYSNSNSNSGVTVTN
jgi:hypothetical protein